MAQVIPYGSLNTQAILAPGAIVQIKPPAVTTINGVPTNIIGAVGSATWGAVNTPVICGSMNEFVRNFGYPVARQYDLGTFVNAATINFASYILGVRVTDGTDTAASATVLDVTTPTPVTGMTVTAIYTGSLGNTISVILSQGSAQNTFKVTVAMPNNPITEIFDNISGSGATLWANIVAAINMGQNSVRGPSRLIVATVGSSTAAPAIASYTLSGGTDGASSITAADMIGLDTSPRSGMYALRGSQASVVSLVDLDTPSTYPTQQAYGDSEGSFMMLVGPPGQTLSQAQTAKNTAGLNDYNVKFLVGDWCYFFDSFNNVTRLISPQGFVAGAYSALAPNDSLLNKQLLGIVATQTTMSGTPYTQADIVFACSNGLDFIFNPSPGGNYFALQTGQNTSSNALERMDAFTRLTNYLAYSIASAIGAYIGQLQNPTVRNDAAAAIRSFLLSLYQLGYIGDVNFPTQAAKAFSVILDSSNNPSIRVSEGYMQADIQVVDYAVIRNFIVNLQNGVPSLNSVIRAPVN